MSARTEFQQAIDRCRAAFDHYVGERTSMAWFQYLAAVEALKAAHSTVEWRSKGRGK